MEIGLWLSGVSIGQPIVDQLTSSVKLIDYKLLRYTQCDQWQKIK